MNDDYVKPKVWEGKSIPFKFKYLIGNYPEMAIASALFLISPLVIYATHKLHPDTRKKAALKYKGKYTVVRHDDPKVDFIKWQKENGRHHFPNY